MPDDTRIQAHLLRTERFREFYYFLIVFFLFLGAGATQPYVVPYIQSRGFSPLMAASIMSLTFLVAFPGRVLGVYLGNAIGLKATLILGTTGYVLYPLLFAVTGEYWQFLLVMTFWGLTIGIFWTAAGVLVLNESDQSRYGKASGVVFAGTGVGMAVGVLLLDYLVKMHGTRTMFILASIPAIVSFILGIMMPGRRYRLEIGSAFAATREALARALKDQETRLIAALQFTAYLSYGMVIGGLSSLIARNVGMAYVGRLTIVFFVLNAVFCHVSGSVSDRIGRKKSLAMSFVASSVANVILILSQGTVGLILAEALLGYQAATVQVNVNAWLGDAVEEEYRTGFSGVMQLGGALGLSLAIVGGSYSSSPGALPGNRQVLFSVFAVLNVLAIFLALRLRESIVVVSAGGSGRPGGRSSAAE